MVAFTSTSSVGSYPLIIIATDHNLGVSLRFSSFVLPLGATINMHGTALYQGICAVFIAQVYGIDLGMPQYLIIVLTATLGSLGTAGDRKSTRLNSSHVAISYAVFCLKKES